MSAWPSPRDPPAALPRSFFEAPVVQVARSLLGCALIAQGPDGTIAGLIVETEAYAGPEDRASHARAGRTSRTAPMFGPAGCAYVYLVYGMHWCLNVVTGGSGQAAAVLLRAVEPRAGITLMRARRGLPVGSHDRLLCAGPARLCQAFGVDRSLDGHDLTRPGSLWIGVPEDGRPPTARARRPAVLVGPRVGVEHAGRPWSERPWRFGLRGSPWLSRPFPAQA
jgi:DNA-3-methyladenine glycosylase